MICPRLARSLRFMCQSVSRTNLGHQSVARDEKRGLEREPKDERKQNGYVETSIPQLSSSPRSRRRGEQNRIKLEDCSVWDAHSGSRGRLLFGDTTMSAKPVRKIPASAKRRDLRCASG